MRLQSDLGVLAQEHAADDVQVAVLLALHRVVAESSNSRRKPPGQTFAPISWAIANRNLPDAVRSCHNYCLGLCSFGMAKAA